MNLPGQRQGGEFDNARGVSGTYRAARAININNNNNNMRGVRDHDLEEIDNMTQNNFNNDNGQENTYVNTNDTEYCYDKLNKKSADQIRVLLLNCNGIPKLADNPLNRELYSAIDETQADIIGLVEHNCNIPRLEFKDTWQERTRGWFESSKSSLSYNRHNIDPSTFLPGGTITMGVNKTSHRQPKISNDPTGMGRWSSILFQGSNNIKLRVITAYRVCKTIGPRTAWSQQERYMLTVGDQRDPRQAILDDLHMFVTDCHGKGEQVLLLMDCNEDVRSINIKTIMMAMGLREMITEDRESEAQRTYNRGRAPIDGIFGSASLTLQAGGYLPFGLFDSDHRGVYVDILTYNAFGFKLRDIPKYKVRRLTHSIPNTVARFTKDYKQFLRDHKLHERIYNLQTMATTENHQCFAQEFNDIMELREKGILWAESRCRKLCMGGVAFSDEFSKATKLIALWKGVCKKKRGLTFSTQRIRNLARSTGVNNPLQCSLEEAIQNKNDAFKYYYTNIKKNAKKLRLTFQEKLARQIASAQNKEYEIILSELQSRERVRASNRRINYTLKKLKGAGVTKIQVKDSNTNEWKDITEQQGIERACMTEFEAKYRQTENTPSMQEPWRSILGYDGKTPRVEQILDGTFIYPRGTHEYVQDFFKAMKREPNLYHPAQPPIMSTSDYISGWKQMKERTSAGISGIHFGHMKACALDPELADFEATVSHIPYATGFTPECWKKGVCCMLPKRINSCKVTDLRTIVLQECEYNFNNKKIGKDAMAHAERNQLIPNEQYGSRKGHRAIDHALNKRLAYDLIRLTRRPAAMCSNDAKACYDRVLHSIMKIAFKRMGFPEPPIDCMISCLQQMQHFIRTTFGTSTSSFSSRNTAIPLQGILQGNGAGPTIWVIVSTPLIKMLREANLGAHLLSSISRNAARFVGFAFVDDTDLITFHANDFSITADEVYDEMQQSIDRWETGIKMTGGAIEPRKSWVYPISFEYDSEGFWSYQSVETNDYNFTVKDLNGTRQPLQQYEVDIGKETLGVILAPDGNNRAAIKDMRGKASKWAALVRAGHLSANDVTIAYDTRIMKTLEYPLLALTLTEKECSHIMAPVLNTSLNRNQLCRTFPRDVCYAAHEELGLGFKSLYTLQGTAQVSAIIQYLPIENDITGQLLRHNIEAIKVDSGLGGNIFIYDYNDFSKHVTDCWIKHVWQFVSANNIILEDNITASLGLKREQDSYIMNRIIQLDKYKQQDIKRINMCRLYLQVVTLSDITTGNGFQFTEEAWWCQRDPSRRTNLVWPCQPRPGSKARKLWRQALKLTFPRDNNRNFLQPLGNWTDSNSLSIWTWFFHPATSSIYRRFGGTWKKYKRRARRGRVGQSPKLVFECDAFSLPNNSLRATVEMKRNSLTLTGYAAEAASYTTDSSFTTKLESSVPSAISAMNTDHRYVNAQEHDIVQQIRSGHINIISDGSCDKEIEFGTAAWVIMATRNSYKIGRHQVTGSKSVQGSPRSELSGILGGILDINDICKRHNIQQGSATIHCDGKGVVFTCNGINFKTSTSRSHYDLLQSIRYALSQSTLDWEFKWVKGHMDERKTVEELNDIEYMNTIADNAARQKMGELVGRNKHLHSRNSRLPYRLCPIYYRHQNGQLESVDSRLSATLYHLIHTDKIRDYWQYHGLFSVANRLRIDRSMLKVAMKGLSKGKQRWVTKWCTGIMGTGKHLERWKQQGHAQCPRCQHFKEDTKHILCCQHIQATSRWRELLQEVVDWIVTSTGYVDMGQILQSSLWSWRQGVPYTPLTTRMLPALTQAVTHQASLGWDKLFYGVWSPHWHQLYQDYFHAHKIKKSVTHWMAALQRKLWMVCWSMWEHRNSVHHDLHNSIHPNEAIALNGEIFREHQLHLDHLPQVMAHLFLVSISEKLQWTSAMKIQWLITVRNARLLYYEAAGQEIPQGSSTVGALLRRWEKKGRTK